MKTRLAEKSNATVHGRGMRPSVKSGQGIKVEKSITINRPAEEIYSFWRQLQNLPHFMQHVESISQIGQGASHWVARTSHGLTLEWDAQIIEDKPGQMISWQSLEAADVDNAGSVWFTPAADGRGTVVKVAMKYSPRGGRFGILVGKLFGEDAEKEMEDDLLRLKDLLETRLTQ